MELLFPALITAGIGLLLGLLLAVFSKVFAVKTDETVEKLTEALPGANCGGCGYAGCADYAEAIKNGEKLNLCSAGGEESYKAVCEIMGVSVSQKMEVKKAVVFCGGCIDYTADKMYYSGINTCKGANMYFQGKGKCDFGCLGIGDCVKACPFGAISVKDDLAVVNRSLCRGCGVCVSACPNGLIALLPVSNSVAVRCQNTEKGALTRKACNHGCIACHKCEKTCKENAISFENGFLARIDYSKCVSCGACVSACPTGAVSVLIKDCVK